MPTFHIWWFSFVTYPLGLYVMFRIYRNTHPSSSNTAKQVELSTISKTGGLVILSAWYGAKGQFRDAVKLKRTNLGPSIEINVENHELVEADPIVGIKKYLVVSYFEPNDNRLKFAVGKEHDRLKIPVDPLAKPVEAEILNDLLSASAMPAEIAKLRLSAQKQDEELVLLRKKVETSIDYSHAVEAQLKDRETAKKRLEDALKKKADTVADLAERLRISDKNLAMLRLFHCGISFTFLNRTVAVQFIAHQDSDLAKKILGFFSYPFSQSPYNPAKTVEHRRWLDNPSAKARIIVFSDEDTGAGIAGIFNDFELIPGEKMECRKKEAGMTADFTFVIFDKVGKEQWGF